MDTSRTSASVKDAPGGDHLVELEDLISDDLFKLQGSMVGLVTKYFESEEKLLICEQSAKDSVLSIDEDYERREVEEKQMESNLIEATSFRNNALSEVKVIEGKMESANEKLYGLRSKVDELDVGIQSKTNEINVKIGSEIKDLQEQLEVKKQGLESTLERKNSENSVHIDLKKSIAEEEENETALEKEAKARKDLLDRTECEPERVRKKNLNIKNALLKLIEKSSEISNKIDSMRIEVIEAEGKNESVEEECEELNKKINIHKENLGNHTETIVSLKAKLLCQENIEVTLKDEKLDLMLKKKELISERKIVLRDISQVKKRFNTLKANLTKTQQQKKHIESILPSIRTQRGLLNDALSSVNQEIHDLTRQELKKRGSLDLLLLKYLTCERVEKEKEGKVRHLIDQVRSKDVKLSEWKTEELRQKRQIYALNSRKTLKSGELIKLQKTLERLDTDIRVREMSVEAFGKKLEERNSVIESYSKSYETIKNEKNKYAANIQRNSQLIAELREKMKYLKLELGVMGDKNSEKTSLCQRIRISTGDLESKRDALRLDFNKARAELVERNDEFNHVLTENIQLNCAMKSMDRTIKGIKGKVQEALQMRNNCGIKINVCNDEHLVMVEQLNDSVETNRERILTINRLNETIRVLKLSRDDLYLKAECASKSASRMPLLELQVNSKNKDLVRIKQEIQRLSCELERPSKARVRTISCEGGNELGFKELEVKVKVLKQRVATKRREKISLEIALEELENQVEKMLGESGDIQKERNKKRSELNNVVGEYNVRNNRLMSLVSELSMNEAIDALLQKKLEGKKREIGEMETAIVMNKAPSLRAERIARNSVRRRLEQVKEKLGIDLEVDLVTEQKDDTGSKERFSAYSVEEDGIQVKKCFGGKAQFLPPQKSSNLRYFE